MRYSGIECVLCHNTFNEKDDVVVCPVCGAPHHRECWMKENRCAYDERHTEGFVWEFPKQPQNDEAEQKKVQSAADFVFKNGEGVIICPECKAANFANDTFCRRCRKPIAQNNMNTNQSDSSNENQNADFQSTNSENQYSDKQQSEYEYRSRQYAPPPQNDAFFQESINRFGGLNPETTIDTIPVVEYSDYIGGKTPGKIIRKISFLERYGKKIIVHLPPILLGPVWFFYRKMAKEGFVASLILLLCSIICCFTSLTAPFTEYSKDIYNLIMMYMNREITYDEYMEKCEEAYYDYDATVLTTQDTAKTYISSVTNYISAFGINLACALLAIKLYRKKIKADILKIRTQCNDMQTYRNKLITNGGTSPALAVIGAMICILAYVIRSTLPMFIAIYM